MLPGNREKNDDPHHGQLDCGQFVVYWRNQAYISDLGSAYYDAQYFSDNRWNYPQASSIGHNVVFVNGELQLPGKLRKKPLNSEIGGKVLEFRSSPVRDYVIMDPTNAYPKKELKNWRRHVILEKPQIVIITDEIESESGAEIETRFHSECSPEFYDNHVILSGKDGKMALIPSCAGSFVFRQGAHAYQPVNALMDFTSIPYFGTVLKASGKKTVVITVISPVKDDSEASGIIKSIKRNFGKSGNMDMSFRIKNKTYKYTFINEKDGLVLKDQ